MTLPGAANRPTTPASDAHDWVHVPQAKLYEVAIFAVFLVTIVQLAVRNSEGPDERASAPPLAPMPMPIPVEPPEPPAEEAHFARTFDVSSFMRGNLHTHTNRSDGDSNPRDVYTWYRDHGYDFVAITDHNTFTNPADYVASPLQPGFVVIGGEEVTMQGAGRQVHVNALCTDHRLPGGRFVNAGEALAHGVGEIREAGAIALINHPNFNWGIKASDLPSALGAQLLEIHSGHPYVSTLGDRSHPSHEVMWDMALTAGLDFMGVAVDDTHHLHRAYRTQASHPGRAWVEVFGDSHTEEAICRALARGLLYASTGPSLLRIAVTENTYAIWPAEHDAEVQFIGAGGRLLAVRKLGPQEDSVSYAVLGWEGYVRARVSGANGKTAWTPAVRVQTPAGQAKVTDVSSLRRPPG